MADFFQPTCLGYFLRLTVVPGSRRTEVVGLYGDRLKVRVAAPPEKGAANAELIAFLSRALKLPKTSLRLTRGFQNRTKILEIQDLSPDLAQRLRSLIPLAE
jgi:uncharacterized protein